MPMSDDLTKPPVALTVQCTTCYGTSSNISTLIAIRTSNDLWAKDTPNPGIELLRTDHNHASSSQSSGTCKSTCGIGSTGASGFLGEAVCSLRTGVIGRTRGVAVVGFMLVEATGWGCFVTTDDQPLPHGDPLKVATGLGGPGEGVGILRVRRSASLPRAGAVTADRSGSGILVSILRISWTLLCGSGSTSWVSIR